jgi:hypothetical protein
MDLHGLLQGQLCLDFLYTRRCETLPFTLRDEYFEAEDLYLPGYRAVWSSEGERPFRGNMFSPSSDLKSKLRKKLA